MTQAELKAIIRAKLDGKTVQRSGSAGWADMKDGDWDFNYIGGIYMFRIKAAAPEEEPSVSDCIREALHALEIDRNSYDIKKSDISMAITWLRRALGQVKPAAPKPVPFVCQHCGGEFNTVQIGGGYWLCPTCHEANTDRAKPTAPKLDHGMAYPVGHPEYEAKSRASVAPEPVPWDEADVIEHLGCVIRHGLNDFLLVSETDYPEGQKCQWKKPGEPDSAFRPCCKEAIP